MENGSKRKEGIPPSNEHQKDCSHVIASGVDVLLLRKAKKEVALHFPLLV